jgi:Ca-activated chloride channel homolog
MATSRNPTIFIIFLFLIGAFLPVAESEQDETNQQQREPFIIKTDVNLVTIDVTVTGDAAVPEMKAEDFVIYDNNIAQPTSYFSQDQIPVAVAILIDNSGSITGYLHELQIAALSALRRLKPEDQVSLFSFSDQCTKVCDLTEDRLLVAKKINQLGIMGSTNVHGALKTVSHYLKNKAPGYRRAIILISDNCHNAGPENSQNALLESSITLYNVITDNSPYCANQSKKLMKIAEESGGEVMKVQGTSLKQALEKAISSLRTQYILGFTPSNPGKNGSFHELKVRFANIDRCPECQIKARRGYYAGVSAPLIPPAQTPIASKQSPTEIDQQLLQRSIFTAGTVYTDLEEIRFMVSTDERIGSNGEPQIQVDLRIGPAGVDFTTIGNRHACKMTAAFFYAEQNGKILGTNWWDIERQLDEESYDRVIKTGIPFSAVIPLKVKKQILKIVIYDEKSGRMGSKLVQLHDKR